MRNHTSSRGLSALARLGRWVCAVTAWLFVAGCASTGKGIQGFDEITLAPGQTGSCESRPCRIYFQMPQGTGTYEVTGTETNLGHYPAGEKVLLGAFWHTVVIQVKGIDVPPAYAYIPTRD